MHGAACLQRKHDHHACQARHSCCRMKSGKIGLTVPKTQTMPKRSGSSNNNNISRSSYNKSSSNNSCSSNNSNNNISRSNSNSSSDVNKSATKHSPIYHLLLPHATLLFLHHCLCGMPQNVARRLLLCHEGKIDLKFINYEHLLSQIEM